MTDHEFRISLVGDLGIVESANDQRNFLLVNESGYPLYLACEVAGYKFFAQCIALNL